LWYATSPDSVSNVPPVAPTAKWVTPNIVPGYTPGSKKSLLITLFLRERNTVRRVD
jgi:hypothetical protein